MLWFLDTMAACLTAIYSARLIALAFIMQRKFSFINLLLGVKETGNLMLSVFVRLVLLSVILGFGLEIMVIGEGSRI
jgi:NADH:ubiquinone oxidoreductase subunit 5 (subunit L)/multisubunit Na+/H+ antiporter MnhA subunit